MEDGALAPILEQHRRQELLSIPSQTRGYRSTSTLSKIWSRSRDGILMERLAPQNVFRKWPCFMSLPEAPC